MDQFVTTFRRFSTDNAVFVPTSNQRDVGSQAEFSIRLVDGAIALAGFGEICERHATANNAFGKPGILIDIRELTGDTESVFKQMRAPTPSTDRIPADVPVAETNKIAASRADAADMLRPTSQTPPLARASDPKIEKIQVAPLPDELDYVLKHAFDNEIDQAAAVEIAADDTAPVEIHSTRPPIATTLGVAPLAPATFVTAPFVNDTPIPRWPRASRPDNAARIVAATAPQLALGSDDGERPERTAMVPLDRTSGEPRPGPWQAFVATLARSVRGVRWWLRRRRSTQQIRTPTAS
ncbi:MAG TPA: hypothetical protein VGG28_00285 [Kofleriaceae bacterium]